MTEFRLTPAARRDLEGIWRYSAQQWGTTQAGRYLDTLNAAFESLAQAPRSGSACDHIRPGYRRQWVEQHGVYYRIVNDSVVVVRILHERMDTQRHL